MSQPKNRRPKLFRPPRHQDQRAEALARLRRRWRKEHENEEWQPEKEPIITPLFESVEGGIPKVIEALRAHNDDDAQEFIGLYDSLTATDAKMVPIESVAYACGLGSLRLAEVAQTALYLYASMQTKLLISSNMPKVTKSIVKAATEELPITTLDAKTGNIEIVGYKNGDVRAMEIFGKMSGIVPIPKGNITAIQNIYGGERQDEEGSKPSLPVWRSSEDRLREFQDLTDPKRLPSPEPKPMLIGGHVDSLQEQTAEIIRGD